MNLHLLKIRIRAKRIMRNGLKIGYRNVVGYFAGTDGYGTVFVSKENSTPTKKGTFIHAFKTNKIYDVRTGEEVSAKDIFGETFFDGDETLKIDTVTPDNASLEEKIDILFNECKKRANDLLESRTAFVMVNDFFEEEDDDMKYTYERFVILYNYLNKCTEKISTNEFSFMHHELMTI